MKLYGRNSSPFAPYAQLLSPTVQSLAVVWEILLGVWLLSGSHRFLAWLAALATFIGFSIVSGYLGIIGQASCGCFGVIETSPWTAFAVDILVAVLLLVGRPPWTGWATHVSAFKWASAFAAVFIAIAGAGILIFGSTEAAIAKLRGESLGVTPGVLDFGAGKPGESLTVPLTVRNYTSYPVRLIGGTSDCSCIVTHNMPVELPPGEVATIAVQMKVPMSKSGQLIRWVELFTDCPSQRTLRLPAGCRVKQ